MQGDDAMNDDSGDQGSSHTPRRSSRKKTPKMQYSPDEVEQMQRNAASNEGMFSNLGDTWKDEELRKFIRSFDKHFDRKTETIDLEDVAKDIGNGRTEEQVTNLFKVHQNFLLSPDSTLAEKEKNFPSRHHDLIDNIELLSSLSEDRDQRKQTTPKRGTPKVFFIQ